VESACKIVIKRADPSLPCEDKVLTKLVEMLAQSNILPSTMQNVFAQLKAIFSASGSVRNSPGAAHGSLELVSPEASVVLLSLRLSGSLIAFLAERYEQIRPPSVP